MATTDLYRSHQAAEAAWRADDMNLELLRTSDAAYAALMAATKTAREQWEAIPASDAKSSAENNAYDTEGTAEDQLRWFEVAIMTYNMNIDGGDFNADGSYR